MKTGELVNHPQVNYLIVHAGCKTAKNSRIDIDDLIHEVKCDLLQNSIESEHKHSSIIINQTRWTIARILKSRYEKEIIREPLPPQVDFREAVEAKDVVENFLKCPELSKQERSLLACYARGDSREEIIKKLKLKSRQRLEQIKRTAFFKIKALYEDQD